MIPNDVKSILIECLNSNIKLEEAKHVKSIKGLPYEWLSLSEASAAIGGTGGGSGRRGSGSPRPPRTGGGAGVGPKGGTGSSPAGSTGSGTGTAGMVYVPAGAPGGGKSGGVSVGLPGNSYSIPGTTSIIDSILSGSGSRDFGDMQKQLQNVVGTIGAGVVVGGLASGLSRLTGLNWAKNQMNQLAQNQEELRGEGLGYTKGWAKLRMGDSSK